MKHLRSESLLSYQEEHERLPHDAHLKVFHLNIRSLSAHIDDLQKLPVTDHVDVICLTETRVSDDKLLQDFLL